MSDTPTLNPQQTLAALEKLEKRLVAIDELRAKTRTVTWIGAVAIILCFGILFWRLYSQYKVYDTSLRDPQLREAMIDQFLADSNAKQIVELEVKAFAKDVETEVLPAIEKSAGEELPKVVEKAQSELEKSLLRLAEYAKKNTEEKVSNALLESAVALENDAKKVFPELQDKKLDAVVAKNKDYFMVEMHDRIEERLAEITPSLELLQENIANMSKELDKTTPNMSWDLAETTFIDSMLELLAYEMKPDIGDEPVPTARPAVKK